jgi:hypothetical protein
MIRLWDPLRRFALFWYGFLVGDDWTIAVGVVASLAVSYGLVRAGATESWVLLPLGAVAVLAVSIRRANRRAS